MIRLALTVTSAVLLGVLGWQWRNWPPPPVAAPAETPPAQQQVPLRPPRVPAGAPPSRADRRAAPAPPER
jgi:hypothetical protein